MRNIQVQKRGTINMGVEGASGWYVQLRKMNMVPLVNKPYVNEVTLREQNLFQKSCHSYELVVFS